MGSVIICTSPAVGGKHHRTGAVAVAIFISCLIIGVALLDVAWLVLRRYFPPDT
jgi:hypothetical protein